ncbi:MAG: hypothetical protein JO219_02840 [Candidatus Eremiobacteraeota bacterium]|nr:hypothetical protein [Candidatus Eremiobacteraeota bacterium]
MAGLCFVIVALLLAGCGGGGGGPGPTVPTTPPAKMASVTINIDQPSARAKTARIRPAYLSPAMQSIAVSVNGQAPVAQSLTTSSANCSTSASTGALTCTIQISAPEGSDTFTFITYDGPSGTGHALSENTVVQTVTAGQANTLSVILDAIPAGIVAYPYPGQPNVVAQTGGGFDLIGTGPASFFVIATDAAKNFIIGPGMPALTVQSSNATDLTVGTVPNNPNDFTLTPLVENTSVALNVSAAGGVSGSASGSVGLVLRAPLPKNLPKPLYVYEGLGSLGTTEGEIDGFPAGSVGASTPTRLISTFLYPYGGQLVFAPDGSLWASGYTDQGWLVVSYSPSQLSGGSDPTPIVYSYYYYIKHGGNANELLIIGSLAADSKGDLFVVGEPNLGGGVMNVYEYAAGFSAASTPTKVATAAETAANLVYVDSKDNLYVVNGGQTIPYSILIYPASAPTGPATRTIAGSNVGFTSVRSLAVMPNGTLYVYDGVTDEVYVFAPGANGNVAPQAVFQSGALNWASPVTIDLNGNVYGSQFLIASNTFQLEAFAGDSVGVVPPLFNVQSQYLNPQYLLFGP